MKKTKAWEVEESAVLLEGFLAYKNGIVERKQAIQYVSEILRAYACKGTVLVDAVFRNVAGITFQIASMESAYEGKTIFKPATSAFRNMVERYRNDKPSYVGLLEKVGRHLETINPETYEDAYKIIRVTFLTNVKRESEDKECFRDGRDKEHSHKTEGLNTKMASESSAKGDVETQMTVAEKETEEQFCKWFKNNKGYSGKSLKNYVSGIHRIEAFLKRKDITPGYIFGISLKRLNEIISYLGTDKTFTEADRVQHRRLSAALDCYREYLQQTMVTSSFEDDNISDDGDRLTEDFEIDKIIFYEDKTSENDKVDLQNDGGTVEEQVDNQKCKVDTLPISIMEDRWMEILRSYFHDGYILNDFLSQFQAAALWEERYAEPCPVENDEIDEVIKSVGTIRDGRVFLKNDLENSLIEEISCMIIDILSDHTCIYRSCLYDYYQSRLSACGIYTEETMTQQLLDVSNGKFIATAQTLVKPGIDASITKDCHQALCNHGGTMAVVDLARELWFIPYDVIYHNLVVDADAINIDTGIWMLAEYFPLTLEDAEMVGGALEKYFVSHDFIQQVELMSLINTELPSIAENISDLHANAVLGILSYYLKNKFSFSKAFIAPKGAQIDYNSLFVRFSKEHNHFTLDELSAFAGELNIQIYWESVFDGGAIRVSESEFVCRDDVRFDVDSIDGLLENLCVGDYLPFQSISQAIMVHFPTCGYPWNSYLLLSYVYGISKLFRLEYNSLGKGGCYGAIVRRSCDSIDSYEHLVERVLIDDDSWKSEDDAMMLLVKKGYQARLRLNGIGTIVEKVKKIKEMRGDSIA